MKSEIMKIKSKGLILINVLVFSVIAITVTVALINWAAAMIKSTTQLSAREQAFHIAEAGIEYYRWHLAHSPKDFYDGNSPSVPGPYIHDFQNKEGNTIGQYSLTITPPFAGSNVVTVISQGTVSSTPGVSRKIKATFAIPSFAQYSMVSDDFINIGEGTNVYGAVHSNSGVRFDGIAHNIVTSARKSFVDIENGNSERFGVYTTSGNDDPSPPNEVPNRPDVFMAGRQFPVPAIDFSGMTNTLSFIKAEAQRAGRYFAPSGAAGYHVILKTNDTFDLYKVIRIKNPSESCERNGSYQSGWGTWSVQDQIFLQNYTFPANGTIFFEDDVWVDGKIRTAKVTIAAGKFPDSPSMRKNIIVNNNLLYTNYDGQDVIALIAQGNITTGLISSYDLRIDAALIAQNGRVGRFYYSTACGTEKDRNSITLYGMIGTKGKYGFGYEDSSGYDIRNLTYDQNLLYYPPPNFPLVSDQYAMISWDEIR